MRVWNGGERSSVPQDDSDVSLLQTVPRALSEQFVLLEPELRSPDSLRFHFRIRQFLPSSTVPSHLQAQLLGINPRLSMMLLDLMRDMTVRPEAPKSRDPKDVFRTGLLVSLREPRRFIPLSLGHQYRSFPMDHKLLKIDYCADLCGHFYYVCVFAGKQCEYSTVLLDQDLLVHCKATLSPSTLDQLQKLKSKAVTIDDMFRIEEAVLDRHKKTVDQAIACKPAVKMEQETAGEKKAMLAASPEALARTRWIQPDYPVRFTGKPWAPKSDAEIDVASVTREQATAKRE